MNSGRPLPDLNFADEGLELQSRLWLLNGAIDFDLAPKCAIRPSHLRFDTNVVETTTVPASQQHRLRSVFRHAYRPWLTNNVILSFEASVLFPRDGYARIYESNDAVYAAFTNLLFTF